MHPEMSEQIKAEVMKQFNVGFLAMTSYPQWVENVVPLPKKYGKVHMCIDYGDLNRASLKMTFHFRILMFWLTTLLNTRYSHSWTDSRVIIRSRWHLKTWKRLLLLHSEALSAIRLFLLG